MRKKQLIFLALTVAIAASSCGSNSRMELPNPSGFISQIAASVISKTTSEIAENQAKQEVEPIFKDEKLTYIYKNRRQLDICYDNLLNRDFAERASKVHEINSQKYIVEFGCNPGAYFVSYQYLLYSIASNGIEIRPLLVMDVLRQEVDSNGQPQLIWRHRKVVSGLPKFDPDSLTLTVSTVRNQGGYEAEYKFENDEFKLVKYTVFALKVISNNTNEVRAIAETKVIYP